jgi:hypothetical protein
MNIKPSTAQRSEISFVLVGVLRTPLSHAGRVF